MRRRTIRRERIRGDRSLAALITLTALIALAGLGIVSACAATGVAHPAATKTPPPAQTAAQLGATLQQVALRQGDLTSGYSIGLMPGGDQVKGQVTLDNCGYDFTTESHRVARRQYVIPTPSKDVRLSNELVAYDSAAAAAQALAQWHTAAARCPQGVVHSSVAAMPDSVEKLDQNSLGVAGLPVAHNAVTSMVITIKGHGTIYDMAILQVHGRFLDNVYFEAKRPISARDTALTTHLALVTGKRLLAYAQHP